MIHIVYAASDPDFAGFDTSHATAIKLRVKDHGMHLTLATCNRPCHTLSWPCQACLTS